MKRIAISVIAVLFAAITLVGCGPTGTVKPVQPAAKTIVVLVDFTGSTLSFKQLYIDDLEEVISRLNFGDVLVVAKITGSSIVEPEVLLKEVVPPFVARDAAGNPTDNPLLVKKSKEEAEAKLEANKKRMLQVLKKAISAGKGTSHTDIMSSLTLAQDTFRDYPDGRPVLVMLSDMMEDSQNYDFYDTHLTASVTQDIINKEKAAGRLPNLQGAKVYVVAAGTEGSDKFFEIRSFWLKYFAATGANLSESNYSNTLLKFAE